MYNLAAPSRCVATLCALLFATSVFAGENANSPHPQASILEWAETCKAPCTLPQDFADGGNGGDFIQAAITLALGNKPLRVVGLSHCKSACTVLVDKIKFLSGTVCVDPSISWGIHIGWQDKRAPDGSRVPLHPGLYIEAVQTWIDQQGGLKPNFEFSYVPPEILEQAYGRCE